MHTTDSSRSTLISSSRRSSLVKIGGSMGMAGSFIALLLFMFALFGFYAAFMLAILPVAFGVIGTVISIVGAVMNKHEGEAETQPIFALFTCATAIIVGMIELHIWMTWPTSAIQG